MNLLKYSNGWGHLLMSIFTTIAGLILIVFSKNDAVIGTGVTLVMSVNAAWFISGSAKQVATEVVNQLTSQPPAQPVPIEAEVTQQLKAVPKGATT